MDTRIYVITHKKFQAPQEDGYIPLQVGRALGEDLGYLGDDTGDNISAKNKSFCELTGVYWIWKNVSCDIVGICHYRRFFVKDKTLLSQKQIEEILQTYDAITVHSGLTPCENLWIHYGECHYEKDLQVVRDIIQEKYPDYLDAFDLSMHCNLLSLGNMIITRKDTFDRYCAWLFDILFEAEQRIDISAYDDRQKRIFGFLSERLMRVWLSNQTLKIHEEDLFMVEEDKLAEEQQLIDKKYHLFELILKDLTDHYHAGNYIDYADNSPLAVDFHGKIPIWVCWWQGYDHAPELVQMCIQSIIRNIPTDIAELHFITMDNVGDYITLPQWIIDRYVNEQMSDSHLSDILRFGLLYRYGGMWLDATYFMTAQISKELLTKRSFYSVRVPIPTWYQHIAQGRWSANFLAGKAGNLIFRYMLNGLYAYWQMQERTIDDELMDYIMMVGYRNLPEVKASIDALQIDQPDILNLRLMLKSKFDRATYDKICSTTSFFKMNRRDDPIKQTMFDEDTFYGYLCKQVL
jgi:Fe-S cluster biosynthesis and repair protein YggX